MLMTSHRALTASLFILFPVTWSSTSQLPEVVQHVTTGTGSSGRNQTRTRHRGGGSRERNGDVDELMASANCELEITCSRHHDDVSSVQLPLRLPITATRRGTAADRTEPISDRCVRYNSGVEYRPMTKVAFFAGLSENIGPISDNRIIPFDRVLTNVGEAYDGETGRFTAPVNGTYQFNVVISAQGRQKAAVTLAKNNTMIATVWAESIPYWASASNVAILELEANDQVWLLLLSRASYLHGYMYSTFSGFLLFET